MSFKPNISAVSISNKALALLPADPIMSMEEDSLEARECRRFYKDTVAKLLVEHHWGLARVRETLAIKPNDRANEWAVAYAKPTDMAYPVSILPASGLGWSGWFARDFAYYLPGGRRLFMVSGDTIYSSIQGAQIEFTSFDINEGQFTPLLEDVIVKSLAASICHPITKDGGRARELFTEAEFQKNRAIASDLNMNQPSYGNKATETEIVRGAGVDLTFYGTGYALDPVANPANTGT